MTINIRAVVRSGVNTLNPDIPIVILQSDGFTVDDAGDQIPQYLTAIEVDGNVQPVPSEELKHINNYNLSSVYRDIYLDGSWHGLNRSAKKGGDLVYFKGFEWLILSLPEEYTTQPDEWTKIRVIQQKASDAPVAS